MAGAVGGVAGGPGRTQAVTQLLFCHKLTA